MTFLPQSNDLEQYLANFIATFKEMAVVLTILVPGAMISEINEISPCRDGVDTFQNEFLLENNCMLTFKSCTQNINFS